MEAQRPSDRKRLEVKGQESPLNRWVGVLV